MRHKREPQDKWYGYDFLELFKPKPDRIRYEWRYYPHKDDKTVVLDLILL